MKLSGSLRASKRRANERGFAPVRIVSSANRPFYLQSTAKHFTSSMLEEALFAQAASHERQTVQLAAPSLFFSSNLLRVSHLCSRFIEFKMLPLINLWTKF